MQGDFVLVAAIFIILGILLHRYVITYDKRIATLAFDGQEYLVRNTPHRRQTADALARLNKHIKTLIAEVSKRNDTGHIIAAQRLRDRYRADAISEGDIDKSLTSYTVNKGEKIVFCMRTRDDHEHLYEDNVLLYVAIHELAHVASVTEEHTPEFHRNFKYLLDVARQIGIFNGTKKTVNYCGIDIPPQ